jgi:hypothetical protein
MMDFARMRYLNNRVPLARLRVERAMSKATRCTSVLTGMPRGGGNGSQVETGVEMLETARAALAEIRTELAAMREDLEPYLEAIEEPLAKVVMTMRYMEGVSAREIAWRLNYSEQHINRLLRDWERRLLHDSMRG